MDRYDTKTIRAVRAGEPYWRAVEGGFALARATTAGLMIEFAGGGVFVEGDVLRAALGELEKQEDARAMGEVEVAPVAARVEPAPDDNVIDLHSEVG